MKKKKRKTKECIVLILVYTKPKLRTDISYIMYVYTFCGLSKFNDYKDYALFFRSEIITALRKISVYVIDEDGIKEEVA